MRKADFLRRAFPNSSIRLLMGKCGIIRKAVGRNRFYGRGSVMDIERMVGDGTANPMFWIVFIVIGGIVLKTLFDKWFRK